MTKPEADVSPYDDAPAPPEKPESRPALPSGVDAISDTISETAKNFWGKAKAASKAKADRPAKVPARKGPRKDTSDLWGQAWEGMGEYLVGPRAPVAARVMEFQVDLVGSILDAETRGTAADRWVMQPIARHKSTLDSLQACLELPMYAELYARCVVSGNAEGAAKLQRKLTRSARRWIITMAPALQRKKAEEAKVAKIVAESSGLAADASLDDLVRDLLGSIFEPFDLTPRPPEIIDVDAPGPRSG